MNRPWKNRLRRGDRGIALVAVLSLILVVTILVVAFVTKSRNSAAASHSFSGTAAANQLARGAINDVQAALLGEIEAGSEVSTVGGYSVYRPRTPQDTPPRLDDGAQTAAQAGVPSLLKSSGTSPFFPGGPSSLASPIATDRASLNGRTVSPDRWNAAALLTAAQNALAPVPQWTYVNREGPVKLDAFSATLATPSENGSPNPDFVIGRYAFRVFDLSGLLDFNVAGFPAQGRNAALIGRKGGLSWLDFFRRSPVDASAPLLAGFDPNAGPAEKGLLAWRGGLTDYQSYVDGFGRRSGFLLAPADAATGTANRFLSRRELIQFVNDDALRAQFPDPEAFLTKAGVFSREVNAPSWQPDLAPAASPAALNPFLAAPRVTQAFTRRDGSAAQPGEPLLAQRFPLTKLALLAEDDPALDDIATFLGLTPGPDGKWIYSAGTVMGGGFSDGQRERLKTLDEIAAENREPNFFELLQAGLRADSLGQGAVDCFLANSWSDTNIARQVLQIGANIIDQYDEDDEPTVIARTPLEELKYYTDTPDPDISGIENLPYIQLIGHNVFRRFDQAETGPSSSVNYPFVTSFFQFQLWNPHLNANRLPEGRFRIVGDGDVQLRITNVDRSGTNAENELKSDIVTYSPANTWMEFDLTADSSKFATPHLLLTTDPSVTIGSPAHNSYTFENARVAGFWQGNIYAPYDGFRGEFDDATPRRDWSHYARFGRIAGSYTSEIPPQEGSTPEQDLAEDGQNLFTASCYTDAPNTGGSHGVSLQLQKFDGQRWRPVQTFPAMTFAKRNSQTEMALVISPPRNGQIASNDYSGLTHANPVMINKHWIVHDPRTTRFGPFHANNANNRNVLNKAAFSETMQWFFYGWLPENRGLPTATYPPSVINSQIGQVYKNLSNTSFRYSDRGLVNGKQVFRNGDASTQNPYTTAAGKPVVLNRPFRSVAELGYAFRDLPWRSLNFSKDTSDLTGQQTADSALLDLFSVSEAPVRAGVVNLNTASEEVLAALLAGTNPAPAPGLAATIADTEAAQAAAAIRTYLGPRENPANVIRTAADLSLLLQALTEPGRVAASWPKPKREALLTALADIHNGRTWNLLIQVSAQSGRFPPGANRSLADFSVTGEKNLIVQLAIDRVTGRIVDSLVEDASAWLP